MSLGEMLSRVLFVLVWAGLGAWSFVEGDVRAGFYALSAGVLAYGLGAYRAAWIEAQRKAAVWQIRATFKDREGGGA